MASITAATAAVIAATVAAAASASATVMSANAQKNAAEFNAEMGRNQAKDALQRGALEAAAKQDKARKIASAQREGAGISGVVTDTGTPLALLVETAGLGKLDAMRSVNNAGREAWGMEGQAKLEEYQGNAAMRGGYLNAAGTLLSSGSSSYYSNRKAA